MSKLIISRALPCKEECKELKAKLEKIKELVSGYRSCYAEPILEIIEGEEDENS